MKSYFSWQCGTVYSHWFNCCLCMEHTGGALTSPFSANTGIPHYLMSYIFLVIASRSSLASKCYTYIHTLLVSVCTSVCQAEILYTLAQRHTANMCKPLLSVVSWASNTSLMYCFYVVFFWSSSLFFSMCIQQKQSYQLCSKVYK